MKSLSRLSFGRNIAAAALVMLPFQQAQAQEVSGTIFQRYRAVAPSVKMATQEVEAHHFDEAKKLLEPVLKEVPDHAVAHYLLAIMAYEGHDFAGALSHIETSEHSLKDLDQRYAKILADNQTKDEADARGTKTSLDDLISAGGDSINDILVSKQQHLNDLESKKRGLFTHEAPFAIPSAYSCLHGNCLYRLGRASEAADQYQVAIHSDPTNAKAWNNLINIYREAKDFDQARATLTKAEAAGVVIQPKLKQSVLEAK